MCVCRYNGSSFGPRKVVLIIGMSCTPPGVCVSECVCVCQEGVSEGVCVCYSPVSFRIASFIALLPSLAHCLSLSRSFIDTLSTLCDHYMTPNTHTHTAQEYGLFKPDEDPTKGRWLEAGRTLEYYHLKSGVSQRESGWSFVIWPRPPRISWNTGRSSGL